MNNIEQNALRIAELDGYELVPALLGIKVFFHLGNSFTQNEIKRLFSSYQGLMPLVFECKKSKTYTINILAVSVVFVMYDSMNELEVIYGKSFETEPEFIEAIQECVIKYLEQKNE